MRIDLRYGRGLLETYPVSPSPEAKMSFRVKLTPKVVKRIMYLFPEQCLLEFVIEFQGVPIIGKGYLIPDALEIQGSGAIHLQD